METKLQQLKKSNYELREENFKLETDLMVAQDLQGYTEIERDKYKKVLQEIKDIIENNVWVFPNDILINKILELINQEGEQ